MILPHVAYHLFPPSFWQPNMHLIPLSSFWGELYFTNIYNPRAEISKMGQVRPTLVRKGATLGANCTIICGHTIGCYAFIGAGAVVTKDVPDHALMVGNPAKQIGWMCVCGEKLDEQGQCKTCGQTFSGLPPKNVL